MHDIPLSPFLGSLENARTWLITYPTKQEGFEVPENGVAPVDEEETF